MWVDECQTGQGLKVAYVAGQEGEAVGEGGGGDDGIGQLHAVLLAQADGVLNGKFIERQFGTIADKLPQGRFFRRIAGPNQ